MAIVSSFFERGFFQLAAVLLIPLRVMAAGASPLEVSIDRNSMGMDESLALTLNVRTEGNQQVGEARFAAPDFDEVNQYSSVFMESYYQNGRFGVRNNKRVTKILKPKRTGTLVISGLSVEVEGKRYEHPPVSIQVVGSGQATQPPARYGGSGMGLRGIGKSVPSTPFTIRVELDHSRVYKGQQVIVSYYLYRRSRVFNIQVDKYPILDGFLREDLDLPILGQRLQSESVVVDGVAYERSLLARYAAYPLKEGKLPIDSMSIKGNYYPGSSADMDPNNPLQSFFQQLQPREWSHRSEKVEIEVLPLPTEGRPSTFTGGVGEFTLDSAVDRTQVKANEALTFTFKIEGSGNVAAVSEPKVRWPQDVEVYESKSRTVGAKGGGVGAKVFEILVIPRKSGHLVIPAAEMGYFSAKDKTYKTTSARAIEVDVLDSGSAAPSQVASQQPQAQSQAASKSSDPASVPLRFFLPDEWKVSSIAPSQSKAAWWVIMTMLAVAASMLAALGSRGITTRLRKVLALRSARRQDAENRSFESLKKFAQERSTEAPWSEVVQAYEELGQKLCLRIEGLADIPARAIGREDLLRRGIDAGIGEEGLWRRVVLLLEYAEWVRFGSSAGMISETEARSRLGSWVTEAERILAALSSGPSSVGTPGVSPRLR